MNKQNFEHTLQQSIEDYRQPRQPSRDLWPAIERGLETPPSRPNGAKWSIAACICLSACLALWLARPEPTTLPLVQHLEHNHQQQVQMLLANYADQPVVVNSWQSQLEEMEQACRLISQALLNDPDNVMLIKMLNDVHQQQLQLIEKSHAPQWQQI